MSEQAKHLAKHFPLNPNYGTGAYRRRIRMVREAGIIWSDLADNYHEMNCAVRHDGATVTAITGALERMPFDACAGAPSALQEFVGMPLTAARRFLYAEGRTSRNCTHLLDLVVLSLRHALLDEARRDIEITIPDDAGGGAWFDVCVNGARVHRWLIEGDVILAPAEFAGRNLFKGFSQWAETAFEKESELEAALVLQKAAFVGRGRRYLLETRGGPPREAPERRGACYTFAEPRFSVAEASEDYVRDYSSGLPESPLKRQVIV